MAKNLTLWGASYSAVPALSVPQTGGGTASFFDVSDTTAAAADVASGKVFLASDGTNTTGTLSFSTIHTGSTTPSSSLGVDGDVYLLV